MTYDQLVAFVAVAAEGTFTAASAALHKSQPAVSQIVRNLEDELGVQLFDRAEYRATLTDAGRLFHERAASVIETSEALKTFGKQLAGRIEPIVRLAVEAVTPLGPVMQILRAAQERYPTVRIELTTERLAGAPKRYARRGSISPSRPGSASTPPSSSSRTSARCASSPSRGVIIRSRRAAVRFLARFFGRTRRSSCETVRRGRTRPPSTSWRVCSAGA